MFRRCGQHWSEGQSKSLDFQTMSKLTISANWLQLKSVNKSELFPECTSSHPHFQVFTKGGLVNSGHTVDPTLQKYVLAISLAERNGK